MARENFTNFGTTALAANITSTSALTFSVTVGQGALFPTSNFLVTIDTEVILISSRSTDTFTVASGGRGYDNSVAATHSSGATVQLSICSYNLTHIWQNVADTYSPLVPPIQLGGSASSYDNEFEAAGSWVLFPTPGGSTVFTIGTSLKSHLLLYRVSSDSTSYHAYVPFTPGSSSFTVTCKISSEAINLTNAVSPSAQTSFFVSDQANPTGGADTGNRVKIQTLNNNQSTSNTLNVNARVLQGGKDVSGGFTGFGPLVNLPSIGALWLRITSDGSGNWQTLFSGDGITYYLLNSAGSISFTPQSLGIVFHNVPTSPWIGHQVAIDYVRVVIGSVLPPYGS